MKNKIILIILFIAVSCNNKEEKVNNRESKINKSELLGNDIRLFQDTPVWNLAKAVEDENLTLIKEEINLKKTNPNYKEPKFGSTLLMLGIKNNKYKSVNLLLYLGADPNLGDSYAGETAMICASKSSDINYLKLLLKYKGNPNSRENVQTKNGDQARKTALTSAISYYDSTSLEKVKLLIDAGADLNYYNEGHTDLPLGLSLTLDKMDVALYLIQRGANYNLPMSKDSKGRNIYILKALRQCVFDLESTEFQQKKQIIQYLKNKGLNYFEEPIPEKTLKKIKKKYPDNWMQYINKY
ncbi:Ankyrin repeat-containing protein [Flavobacterium omnivorum]|uniref:Ankyrin repeat-containing protein n=1 Tax=Flavobacterium omnivorum TaxID=178355 RepID=A0A1G8J3J8_9FLAO|nr:ankyrin repeat domain-containing protein [Flavobacterium omnivorum]SDI25240.1 Ankyrin repeat-containing protein [Flavobacterium omnivorum]